MTNTPDDRNTSDDTNPTPAATKRRSALLHDLINDPGNAHVRAELRVLMDEHDIEGVVHSEAWLRRELQMLSQVDQVPVPEIVIPRLSPLRIRLYRLAPFIGAAMLVSGLVTVADRMTHAYQNVRHLGQDSWMEAYRFLHATPMVLLALGAAAIIGAWYTLREE
ncbi:MAG: hypothetical protein ACKOAX_09195 [Candidatus Kapaibacterium sp.]